MSSERACYNYLTNNNYVPGTATGSRSAGLFDPLNQASRGASGSPGLDGRKEETPEDKIKHLEKKVNELIEESCFAAGRGELKLALDRYSLIFTCF